MLKRTIVYIWASPGSAIGLCCVPFALVGGGGASVVDGVLEVYGGLLARLLDGRIPVIGSCAAMTLGHVVIGQDRRSLNLTRAHERVHVRQYEQWGPFFIPAYLSASLLAWMRRRHPYLDNPFERAAYREAGV